MGDGWGDTSMAQDAYKSRIPGLILGFRGFKFRDSCYLLDFETSYVALLNGFMISDIRILVLYVYSLSKAEHYVVPNRNITSSIF